MKHKLVAFTAALVIAAPMAASAQESPTDVIASPNARFAVVDVNTGKIVAQLISVDGQSRIVRVIGRAQTNSRNYESTAQLPNVLTIQQENEAAARAFAQKYHMDPSP